MKTIDYKKQGKRNRAAGQRFELKVRKDLEKKEWIVDRWSNNVLNNKLVPAKSRFGLRTTGFPDFISFKIRSGYSYYDEDEKMIDEYLQPTYDRIVIGVECKSNGDLDKEEKEKCRWLSDNEIFSKIFIASKGKKRGEIIYKEFK